jgi:hypothetical protein
LKLCGQRGINDTNHQILEDQGGPYKAAASFKISIKKSRMQAKCRTAQRIRIYIFKKASPFELEAYRWSCLMEKSEFENLVVGSFFKLLKNCSFAPP